ncbi:BglG family transcription antiterminator [Haloimpatiens sp. FM7330]|uniref:BglG family transcription antiterminator n=1 Tax=Haloimpatiens sp. FM7330 TaxID=3298610 RepID=UPI0036412610
MNLNKLSTALLIELVNARSYVKVSQFASKYKVTNRTIRYNLEKVEKFLLANGFDYLDRQHIKGVRIIKKDDKLKNFVKKFKGEYTPYKYIYSKEEKFKIIITKLLEAEKPINLGYFQTKFYISKNTLLKDLLLVEQYLKDKKLSLIKKPRVGLYITGEEKDKRTVLNSLISQTVSLKDIFSYIKRNETLSKINNFQFETLFSNIDIEFINNIIVEIEHSLKREFNDEAYGNLITHIAIMIKRIQLCKKIYLPEVDIESIYHTKEFSIAKKIVVKIEKHYKINVPAEEIGYITLRFLGAKFTKDYQVLNQNDLFILREIAEKMTNEMELIYNFKFGKNKNQLIDGLLIHLRPAVYRIKFNLNLENPMFDDIVQKYKQLFLNTKYAARHLSEYIGKNINDQEISYIALHFEAAIENIQSHKNLVPRVIIVCSTGIGTAKMLAVQIKKAFNIEIVNTVSTRAILKIDSNCYDYIISTIDIPEFPIEKYIKINALLTKYDYDKLGKYLNVNMNIMNASQYTKKVNLLMNAVSKQCEIKDSYLLQYEFMKILLEDEESIVGEEKIRLQDLLKYNSLLLKEECRDWKEAIMLGSNVLVKNKSVRSTYGKAIVKSIEELGPYMVIAPGVVLSHGKPDEGALKLSMSLVTLKQGVDFGDDFKKKVKLVITLAAVDKESHIKALSQLMELVKSKSDVQKIIDSNNKEDVIKVIKKYSILNVNF